MTNVHPTSDVGVPKHRERQKWGSSIQFLLACIGYSVGLGNIWRFPSLAYENGGGAFLIPYLCCSFFFGLPILYLEMTLGQFGTVGPGVLYGRLRPIFQGIGWSMAILSWLVGIYYQVIVAWILIYLYIIVTGQSYKWRSCSNDFNTEFCFSTFDETCMKNNSFHFNRTCHPMELLKEIKNISHGRAVTASTEFFEIFVLEKSETMDKLGGINIKVMIALIVAWITTFLVLWKGVKIIGKVAFFTSTTPYLIIAIMFVQSWTLKDHIYGLEFYLLDPDFSKVLELSTWKAAVTQNCYSLGVGFGGLLSLASFNKKNHNCFRDAILVSVADGFMSIFGGVAIFNVLGFMAKQLQTDITDVVQSGTGLAFIAYPEAISHMPVSWLWALLFFLMLWLLGVDSQFGLVEVISTSLKDQFPSMKKHEGLMVFATCLASFLVGLIMTTKAGIFYFDVFDSYSASLGLMILLMLEIILVIYIYGCANYIDDIRLMLGSPKNVVSKIFGPSGWYIKIMWLTISPILAFAILIVTIYSQATSQLSYGHGPNKYEFPAYSTAIGWFLSTIPLIAIPILILFRVYKLKKEGKAYNELFRLQPKWPSYKLHFKNRVHPFLPSWMANIIDFSDIHDTQPNSNGPTNDYM